MICGIDADPRKAALLKKWGRDYWNALHRFNPGGAYVNFMMDDEVEYDPANLFRVNQNIAPAGIANDPADRLVTVLGYSS